MEHRSARSSLVWVIKFGVFPERLRCRPLEEGTMAIAAWSFEQYGEWRSGRGKGLYCGDECDEHYEDSGRRAQVREVWRLCQFTRVLLALGVGSGGAVGSLSWCNGMGVGSWREMPEG